MKLTLSPRLACIAGFVPQGSTAVDVGTDHAYIPIWLLQSGISERAYATDIKPGPLRNAETDAARAGVSDQLTLYLCDGLALCPPEAVDTVLLAGMGGETMMNILDAAPWALEKRLILQPQTKLCELRLWLRDHGLGVLDASLVHDAGRIYLVWLVGKAAMTGVGPVDPPLIEKRDPLLKAYTDEWIKRHLKQIQGLEIAKNGDSLLLARLKAELDELKRINREAAEWYQ